MWLGWRTEFWWQFEQLSHRIWDRLSRDGVTAGWFDYVTAYTYRHRKRAEKRYYLRRDGY